MTDNGQDRFDLELRSILEDAEVKPSKRVWRNISSRLDEAEAAASPRSWAGWAGAALALAACLVAGIFIFRTPENPIPTYYNNEEPLMAQVVSEASDEIIDPVRPQTPIGKLPTKALRQPKIDQSEITPAVRVPESESKTESPSETPANQDKVRKKATEETPERTISTERLIDTWEAPGQNEGKKAFKRGATLFAQGVVGGNDSDISFKTGTASMAPGSAYVNEGGMTELSESTYGVPFSLGLGVRFNVSPSVSIGTGLSYSLLTRTFTGKSGEITGSVLHSMSYLGIPLNVYYSIINAEKLNFYVYGGGQADFCLSNKYTLYSSPDIVSTTKVKRPQFSVDLGLGVEFKLNKTLGIYLDPGVSYYFHCDQPRNIHTDKPLMFNFNAGLRFNL